MMFINGKIMIWLNNLISKDDQMDKKMIGVKVQLPVNGHQDFEGTVVNRKGTLLDDILVEVMSIP